MIDDRAEAVDRCELHLGGLMLTEVMVKKPLVRQVQQRSGEAARRRETTQGKGYTARTNEPVPFAISLRKSL